MFSKWDFYFYFLLFYNVDKVCGVRHVCRAVCEGWGGCGMVVCVGGWGKSNKNKGTIIFVLWFLSYAIIRGGVSGCMSVCMCGWVECGQAAYFC